VRRKQKKSLGNDVFGSTRHRQLPGTIAKILRGRRARRERAVREVEVRIKLTPSNLKHLDALNASLEQRGKRRLTRGELIRAAITLLNVEDF
jgi:hypothetical protein